MSTLPQVIEDYEILVRRDPTMTNAEIARQLGMPRKTLVTYLARGRRKGLTSIYRVGYAHTVEIAPPGCTNGHLPTLYPKETRRARRGRRNRLDGRLDGT